MPSFYKRIKETLGFSKREMNGLIILLPLTVLLILAPTLYTSWFSVPYAPYEDQRILDSIMAVIEEKSDSLNAPSISPEKFKFDPNQLNIDSLKLLGLPTYVAQRIINYRKAGGQFRRPEDLKKMYGLEDSIYQKLVPFIQILKPEPVPEKQKVVEPNLNQKDIVEVKIEELPLPIGINLADSLMFQDLRGIGPVYSSRIISFRESLGGFTNIDQVAEVYGISDSLFYAIRHFLVIKDSTISRLPINFASFKELNRHPYISYEQTKEIMHSKSKVGKFKSMEEILALKTFDSLSAYRLFPYLDFK